MNAEQARKEFGFTNDPIWLQRAIAWRDAAMADGWSIQPTYESESSERASTLHKEGWTAQILTRDNSGLAPLKYLYEASVNVWGPDGMGIIPPDVYDWEKIKAGLTTCNSCGKPGVETHRYSFAGRCCAECLPSMRKKHEYPGWAS